MDHFKLVLSKKTKVMAGAIAVVIIATAAVTLSFVLLPQPHSAFISEQKAGAILNETFYSNTSDSISNAIGIYAGARSVNYTEYLGTDSVVIDIVQYNESTGASTIYGKQCVFVNGSEAFTINATYRGYKFSYEHLVYFNGHQISTLYAWCLLKNYFVEMRSLGLIESYSNTTIVNFIHAQMDAML